MLEMRSNVLWCERKCSRFLKHNGDYVVSNMSLSQELQQEDQNKMKNVIWKDDNKACPEIFKLSWQEESEHV